MAASCYLGTREILSSSNSLYFHRPIVKNPHTYSVLLQPDHSASLQQFLPTHPHQLKRFGFWRIRGRRRPRRCFSCHASLILHLDNNSVAVVLTIAAAAAAAFVVLPLYYYSPRRKTEFTGHSQGLLTKPSGQQEVVIGGSSLTRQAAEAYQIETEHSTHSHIDTPSQHTTDQETRGLNKGTRGLNKGTGEIVSDDKSLVSEELYQNVEKWRERIHKEYRESDIPGSSMSDSITVEANGSSKHNEDTRDRQLSSLEILNLPSCSPEHFKEVGRELEDPATPEAVRPRNVDDMFDANTIDMYDVNGQDHQVKGESTPPFSDGSSFSGREELVEGVLKQKVVDSDSTEISDFAGASVSLFKSGAGGDGSHETHISKRLLLSQNSITVNGFHAGGSNKSHEEDAFEERMRHLSLDENAIHQAPEFTANCISKSVEGTDAVESLGNKTSVALKDLRKIKGSPTMKFGRMIPRRALSRVSQPALINTRRTGSGSTYNQMLADGRLSDCIKLLESMKKSRLLNMDKLYHARFLMACRKQRAVQEAFQFVELIKKPNLSTFNMLMSVCACSKDTEGAFRVLQLVNESGLKADYKLYTTLISTCAKSGKVDLMFEVFHEMVHSGVEPNLHTYGALIDGCARAGQVAKAFGAYGIMRSKKVKPDRVIFNALITACGQSGAIDRAFDVLSEMKAEEPPMIPDHVTVGALMKTCAHAGKIDQAFEVYDMMNQYSINGTVEVYTIAVNCCSVTRDIGLAHKIYDDMKRNSVTADEVFVSAFIDVAGHSGNLDLAFEILSDARKRGMRLSSISYGSLMGACSNAKDWKRAVELYEDIKRNKECVPSVSMMNALITTLCDGGELEKSLKILSDMRAACIAPNSITYSALLVSCTKKDEVELAFDLLMEAKQDGVKPNLTICKCFTGLCLKRFKRACSVGEPVISFQSGNCEIANQWTSWALVVYRETISNGIVPTTEIVSQVLQCLKLPDNGSLKNRLIENLGMKTDVSRNFSLSSLLDGFGEYDPRSFSILEEAAALGVVPCVSFKGSLIPIDATEFELHMLEVYLLTVLKGLKHRLAAGARLPSISLVLPVETTSFPSSNEDKTIKLATRVGQSIGSLLRRLRLPYQGDESNGRIKITGAALTRWFQPSIPSDFGEQRTEFRPFPSVLAKGITEQQRRIRNASLSI